MELESIRELWDLYRRFSERLGVLENRLQTIERRIARPHRPAYRRRLRPGLYWGGRVLPPTEEERRRAVYATGLTDRGAGKGVGITGQGFQMWRKTRGLPPHRKRGQTRLPR